MTDTMIAHILAEVPGIPERSPNGTHWRVTIRKGGGKAHPALLNSAGAPSLVLCRCPGAMSGALFDGASIVAHGHAAQTCGGAK